RLGTRTAADGAAGARRQPPLRHPRRVAVPGGGGGRRDRPHRAEERLPAPDPGTAGGGTRLHARQPLARGGERRPVLDGPARARRRPAAPAHPGTAALPAPRATGAVPARRAARAPASASRATARSDVRLP